MTYPVPPAGAPVGAPDCWSRQYIESDTECRACAFRTSCRSAHLAAIAVPSAPPRHLPVVQQQPYQAPFVPSPQYTQQPPAPPQAYYPPQRPPQYAPQQMVQQVQYPAPHVVPDSTALDPYRAQSPYFPQESTAARLGKNMALRMAETGCMELARFFHFWSWPADRDE